MAVTTLFLAACSIEVGPPPEADPPLVSQAAKEPPAPPQPSGPQPWSRDLDFHSAPGAVDRSQMVDGLVASDAGISYSEQRLTYESAFEDARPQSEAELALQRARERAAAAGLPAPPQVAAAPVAEVSAAALPAEDHTAAAPAPRRESRLPPPPKFPPLPADKQAAGGTPAAEPAAQSSDAPAAEPAKDEGAATEPAADQQIVTAAFAAESWDAPAGSILVQVSAITDGSRIMQEWQELQNRYPQVLKPLKLVVEEARLGERNVFYRVQAGAFGSREGAAEACDSLIDKGQPCFVVVR